MKPHLNRRLVLEAVARVPDGAGGFVESWQSLGTVWAEILPGAGRDVAGEEVILSRVAYRIVVRAAPVGAPSRPLPAQRFREGMRVFRILAVTEQDRAGRYLTCFTAEEEPL
jgi:head-tail adaptor